MVTRRGILAGIGGVGTIAGVAGYREYDTRTADDTNQFEHSSGLTLAIDGPACVANFEVDHSGWVYTTATELAFDIVVEHDRGETVDATLDHVASDTYRIDVTVGVSEQRSVPIDDRCSVGTRLTGSGVLPEDHEVVQLFVAGEEIQTVERAGSTMPKVRRVSVPGNDSS